MNASLHDMLRLRQERLDSMASGEAKAPPVLDSLTDAEQRGARALFDMFSQSETSLNRKHLYGSVVARVTRAQGRSSLVLWRRQDARAREPSAGRL